MYGEYEDYNDINTDYSEVFNLYTKVKSSTVDISTPVASPIVNATIPETKKLTFLEPLVSNNGVSNNGIIPGSMGTQPVYNIFQSGGTNPSKTERYKNRNRDYDADETCVNPKYDTQTIVFFIAIIFILLYSIMLNRRIYELEGMMGLILHEKKIDIANT